MTLQLLMFFTKFERLWKTKQHTHPHFSLIRVTNALLRHVIFQALCDSGRRQTEVIVRAQQHRYHLLWMSHLASIYFSANWPLTCTWYGCICCSFDICKVTLCFHLRRCCFWQMDKIIEPFWSKVVPVSCFPFLLSLRRKSESCYTMVW